MAGVPTGLVNVTNPESAPYQLPTELLERLSDFQQFVEIDSTNAEALRQIQAGRTGTFLIIAHTQSAGRGRRGRLWHSPVDAGIYLTMVRPFSQPANNLQALSLVTALSVLEGLRVSGASGIQLKWPNDLLVNKKKLAGILLELKQREGINCIVFGVGINLKLPVGIMEKIARPATDLTTLLGHSVDKSEIVAQVVTALLANLEEFENTGFKQFHSQWNMLDCYLNQDIVLQNGEQRQIGKSLGVDEQGALILQTATGITKINGGEIFPSLRPS